MQDAKHDAQMLLVRRSGFFGGEYEECEDWQYKVRMFLNSECSLIARFLTFLESVDREIDLEDVLKTMQR